ncbi:MAG: Holliday junction resolvase RuvX, partial [Anaerolineaceae bacterium]
AISDESGTLARPLNILRHVSRPEDAHRIAEIAQEAEAGAIVVGMPLGAQGEVGPKARSSLRLIEALRAICQLPVIPWDESYSSQKAAKIRIQAGVKRKTRAKPIDDLAAAVILQSYLDRQENVGELA